MFELLIFQFLKRSVVNQEDLRNLGLKLGPIAVIKEALTSISQQPIIVNSDQGNDNLVSFSVSSIPVDVSSNENVPTTNVSESSVDSSSFDQTIVKTEAMTTESQNDHQFMQSADIISLFDSTSPIEYFVQNKSKTLIWNNYYYYCCQKFPG